MAGLSVPALVADLGATNARFARLKDGTVDQVRVLRVADYPSLVSAMGAYLDKIGCGEPPRAAAVAIASPIVGDRVEMTNHAWSFSISELKAQMALRRLEVINDFTAQALSLPHLSDQDVRKIGGGEPRGEQPLAILGPGTGLGVSGLIPSRDAWIPVTGEGGHVTMSPVDAREEAVIARLRQRFHHVSAERVLSGMGLANLYETLYALDGEDAPPREPKEVSEAARSGADPHASEALAMFAAMLGTVAGNLALTLGALGGVYVGGGIVPSLGDLFDDALFRERFEAKGRFKRYLQSIPTYVITRPHPAFLGLKHVLERKRER
jgi:glucokinase